MYEVYTIPVNTRASRRVAFEKKLISDLTNRTTSVTVMKNDRYDDAWMIVCYDRRGRVIGGSTYFTTLSEAQERAEIYARNCNSSIN